MRVVLTVRGAAASGQLGTGKDAALVAANRNKPAYQCVVEYKTSFRPVQVTAGGLGSKHVTSIASGGDHCLAFVAHDSAAAAASGSTGGGVVYVWGMNRMGQCGLGASTANVDIPTEIKSLTPKKIVSIAAGEFHSLALGSDGVAYAWGQSNMGQCGTGKQSDVREPTAVTQVMGSAPAMQHPIYTKPGEKKAPKPPAPAPPAGAAATAAAAPAAPTKPVPVAAPNFAAIYAGGTMSWFVTHIVTVEEARKKQKLLKVWTFHGPPSFPLRSF